MMGERIEEHIDELLWRVAESRDADLTADFLRRYPAMRAQLATREAMVDALRGARPVPPIATRFVPARREPVRRPKLWLAPLAAGLLIGLAIASYQIVKFNSLAPKEPEKKAVVVPQSPVPTPRDGREIKQPTYNSPYPPGTGARPEEVRSEDGLVVIKVDGASLFAALGAIRAKGVQVEIMPGLEDMPITLTANREDGTLALDPVAMLNAVQAASGFDLVSNGPDGYMALPSDKTTIIDAEPQPRVRSEEIDGN